MSARSLRVGTPPFLVARPLDTGLGQEPGVELVHAVPAMLVAGLRDGSLDVALVSSIELFRRPGYAYLAGPAIVGRGSVASVRVFLLRPLERVRAVALDPSSRAAQALVRIVLPRRLPAPPRFVEVASEDDPRAAAERGEADAWLRIGDAALREVFAQDAPPSFDPCRAWVEDTGLPFVFAPWVVRPGLELEPREVEAFLAARARGALALEGLARDASRRFAVPLEACLRYLAEECRYDAGDELEPALIAFRDAAAALGLCRGDLAPRALPTSPPAPCRRG